MREPRRPTNQEVVEISALLEHALANPIAAEAIIELRKNAPAALSELIEAHTVSVLGLNVCVLFEIHDGALFQRVRLAPSRETQPSYDLCMDILPHLGILRDMQTWAASWAEVIYPDEKDESPPQIAYNISQIVVPNNFTLH